MRLFDWLKPSRTPVELTRDYVNINDSALAKVLEGGSAVVLEKGQILVPPPKYPEAQRIADSLRDFPEDWMWETKGYRIKYVPSGFRMWVASGQAYLAECTEGKDIDFRPEEQAIIWPAVESWLDSFKVGFTGRPVKPRITAYGGSYFCESSEHPWRGVGRTADEAYRAWLAAISVKARGQMPKGDVLTVWSDAR